MSSEAPHLTSAAPADAPPIVPLGTPRGGFDSLFVTGLSMLLGSYVALIAGLLLALAWTTSFADLWNAVRTEETQYAVQLSLLSCTLSSLLSLWIAVPGGYLLSRYQFPGKGLVDAVLDIPIVLPPLVIGLALLILFQTRLGRAVEQVIPVTFAVPSVVLAQFTVACAFAVRTMRVTFDQISRRPEQVALTLGCSRAQAFWMVALPEARRGVLTAATLAWACSLGEFGPILIFSGTTHFRTEVLSTRVFLEFNISSVEAAAAVSLLMVAAALVVLLVARIFGLRGTGLI